MSKILIVEDNEENWDMLSRRLRRRGYEVLIAVDGAMGLELSRAAKPDLLLLDMNLPEIDGWSVVRRLREEGNATAIIALTAHAMTSDRERALQAGCDDYHSKPVELPLLLDQIERLLDPSRSQAS